MIQKKIIESLKTHLALFGLLMGLVAFDIFSSNASLIFLGASIVYLHYIVEHFRAKGVIGAGILTSIAFLILFSQYGFTHQFYNALYTLMAISIISSYLYNNKIQEEKEKNDQLNKLAIIDELTGLYNSRYYYDFIKSKIDQAKNDGLDFGVMVIDIDNFRKVNEKYGREKGDFVINKFATKLLKVINDNDMLFRIYGDEFIIVIDDIERNPLKRLSARITGLIDVLNESKAFDIEEDIHVSIGASTYPKNDLGLFRVADESLEKSKKKKGNVATFDEENNKDN